MVSRQPVKFGGHWHCGNGDRNTPVNTVILPQMRNIRHCLCQLASNLIFFSKAHCMSFAERAANNNLMIMFDIFFPILFSKFWGKHFWN